MLRFLPKRQKQLDSLTAHASLHGIGGHLHFVSSSLKLLTARQGWGSVGFSAWTFLLEGTRVNVLSMGGKQKETGLWVSVHVWEFIITLEASKRPLLAVLHSWLQHACISSPCFLTFTKDSPDHLAQMLRMYSFGLPRAPGFYGVSIIMNSVAL